jgi:Fe-S-cluster containining protein
MSDLRKEDLFRLSFPEDELKRPWLPMLLDAYATIDEGVAVSLAGEEKKRNIKLACRKGCAICCSLKDIPVYPLELVGIYWFATEKTEGAVRETIKKQLTGHGKDDPCPFLIDLSCSIHPVRPISCRQFNVMGSPCAEGEDPYYTRRGDVLTPIQEFTNTAFYLMLPFYGITDDEEKTPFAIADIIHEQATNLRQYDWRRLAGTMDGFDSKNP